MKDKIISFLRIDENFPKILVTTIICYYYKTAFWPITYLFVLSYVLLIALFLIRQDWKFRFSGFFHDYLPPFVLAGILIIAVVINGQFSYSRVQKDLLLVAVLFSLFYFLYWVNVFLKKEIPRHFTINILVYTTLIICGLNILYGFFAAKLPTELLSKLHISDGSTMANDYNFYCLFVLFGLILLNFKNEKNVLENEYSKIARISISFIFLVNVVLSGSRRGIIVFLVLLFSYFISEIVKGRKISGFKKLVRKSLIFISSGILFILFTIIVFQKIPKVKITMMALRYSGFIGTYKYNYISKILWDPVNKISKETGQFYASSKSKINTKYLLSSDKKIGLLNVKTPFGNGIKTDRKTNNKEDFYLYYNGPAILYLSNHSYELSFKIKLNEEEINSLSVGWIVDDGEKGYPTVNSNEKEIKSLGDDWYSFIARYTFIDNQIGVAFNINLINNKTDFSVSNIEISDLDFNPKLPDLPYELTSKEKLLAWLNMVNPPVNRDLNLINNGDFRHGLGFWLYSADSLNIKIAGNNSQKYAVITRGNGDGGFWSLYYGGRIIEFKENDVYEVSFKMKPIYPQTIPFSVGFDTELYLPLEIDTLRDGWLSIKAKYTPKNNQSQIPFPITQQIDNSQFYITDIRLVNLTHPQYLPKSISQLKDTMSSVSSASDTTKKITMLSSRTSRWLYAAELWRTEYKWYNKLFGYGFNYYKWFGHVFNKDSVTGDYPHNPLITILLYSGIFGLMFYLWLLYKVLYLYIFYRKEYGIFFVCFLITFFFSFFSGGSPFDPPIMGFFILLPFYIHLVHKNRDQIKSINKNND